MDVPRHEFHRQFRAADLLVGGLDRRRFIQIGGLSVATAALLVACGDEEAGNVPSAGLPSATTGLPERAVDDIVLLRTSSSLEHSIVFTYEAVLPLVTPLVASTLELLRDHHEAHAREIESATEDAGGEAFTEPNPVLQSNTIEPTLEVITGQGDPEVQLQQILVFAHSLENIAAATYQSTVPLLAVRGLRETAMSVGVTEARHAAVLAGLIDGAAPVAGLETLDPSATTVSPGSTTTVAGEPDSADSTTTTSPALALPESGVFQVPGAFGALATSLGPNSYMYDERTLTTTEPG